MMEPPKVKTFQEWKRENPDMVVKKHDWEDCPVCNGIGELTCDECNGEGCSECDMSGQLFCLDCLGAGGFSPLRERYDEEISAALKEWRRWIS